VGQQVAVVVCISIPRGAQPGGLLRVMRRYARKEFASAVECKSYVSRVNFSQRRAAVPRDEPEKMRAARHQNVCRIGEKREPIPSRPAGGGNFQRQRATAAGDRCNVRRLSTAHQQKRARNSEDEPARM